MRLSIDWEERANGTRHWLRLRKSASPDIDIFFDFIGEHAVPLPRVADGYIQAVIHRAMALGEEIWVDGIVTRQTLQNLREYQDMMHAYYPNHYRRVPIRARDVVDLAIEARPPRALSCFSGGIDGSFSLVRHRLVLKDESALPIEGALMVHRLKRSHEHKDAFGRLADRVRPLLDELGVRLHLARTNLTAVIGHDYFHTYGAQLSSWLHNYAYRYDCGVIGSSRPYIALVLPYGSSPVADHLMSSGAMKIIHDGAAFTRTAKAALLANYPTAIKTLHVCIKHDYENCGTCMKCARTRLNFLAAGIPQLGPFRQDFSLDLIDRIGLNRPFVVEELRSILDYAHRNGITDAWTKRLQSRLDAHTAGVTPNGAGIVAKLRHNIFGAKKKMKRTKADYGVRAMIGSANPTNLSEHYDPTPGGREK